MKILICNLSGNMGKTTLVKHLLAPRMAHARVVTLESTNSGIDELKDPIRLDADDFATLVDVMALEDDLIVDLGSAESKETIRKLKEYENAVHEFDLICIPVVPDPKAQEDTVMTVMTLHLLGVPKEKIRILFNRVPVHLAGKIQQQYGPLIRATDELALFDEQMVVMQYEIYNSLKGATTTISQVMEDKTDWKSIARDKSLPEVKRLDALQMNRIQKGAPPAHRNLDVVFGRLFGA